MSNEANLSEKEKWLNLSQSLEKDLDRIRFELQSALTANDLLVKQLAEAENEIECIDAHIEALVDPTILEEIRADKIGDRPLPLQVRVMRIFMFLDSAIKNNLEKDKEIVRLNKALKEWELWKETL